MAKLLVGSTVNGNLIWHDGGTSDREMTMVYQNISQSITTGAFTQMTFDTVKFDNIGTWVSSNNSMTIKKGGIYIIDGMVSWQNVTSGTRGVLEVRKNGVSARWLDQSLAGSAKTFSVTGIVMMQLAVGDVITLWGFQDTSGSMGTQLQADQNSVNMPLTYFSIAKIA